MHALILVDIQNDFLPGGALAVPRGDEVVPIANALQPEFDVVVATRDFHPPGHGSFASSRPGAEVGSLRELDGLPQVMWPDHCVQGTRGSELAPGLDRTRVERVFVKGTDPRVDSYSAFFDNARRGDTGLAAWLRERGVTEVTIVGLATDYCVRFTALDAVEEGFETTVFVDGCRGVELRPGDVQRALSEMEAAGVRLRRL